MKANIMLLNKANQDLVHQEVVIPSLKEGEALLQLVASGICGSDDYMRKGKDPRTPYPIILGHEIIGRVQALTSPLFDYEGKAIQVGDVVLVNRGINCKTCSFCLDQKAYLCQDRQIYGINMAHSAENPLTGGYSDYLIVKPGTDLYLVEKEYEPKYLVSAGCSGATMAHAIVQAGDLKGKTVLIHGSGPLGLYGVLFAHDLGAKKVILIGSRENRLRIATTFGATLTLDYKETTQEERYHQIMAYTNQQGVDVAIEATGNKQAFIEDVKLLRKGGHYLLTGYSQPSGEITLDLYQDFVFKNLKIEGIWVSDSHHVFQALSLTKRYYPLFSSFLSNTYRLHEVNEALDALKEADAMKICIDHL